MKIIDILNIFENKDIAVGLGKKCRCGKEHILTTKEIYIGEDACSRMAEFIGSGACRSDRGLIICDGNTRRASNELINLLSYCKIITLNITSHHADMSMIEDALVKIRQVGFDFDFFIAAGSGTIHDITRVIAHNSGKPFISFPTAPSVDGFVSTVAPVTSDGMKVTLEAVAPIAVFADSKVICAAPKRLTASGAGDILGKYISLADWKTANCLIGEYICDGIIESEYAAVDKAKEAINAYIAGANAESYNALCISLLEALIISGVCMQLIGNSRPASGAEHHIAHFFEMGVIASVDGLHGENVGVGSILCSEIYHRFRQTINNKISFEPKLKDYELNLNLIKKYYKDLTTDIIKQNAPNELIKVTPEVFYANIDKIKAIAADIPSKDEIAKLLKALGGVTELKDLGVRFAKRKADLSLKLAPYVRNRFTLLKLMRLIKFSGGVK